MIADGGLYSQYAINDNKDHVIGLRYLKSEDKYTLYVDGQLHDKGGPTCPDVIGAQFKIGRD